MLLYDFVEAQRRVESAGAGVVDELELVLPSASGVFVRLFGRDDCPGWVEDVSLPGVTVREGSSGVGFRFVWHFNSGCGLIKVFKRGVFKSKGDVFVNLRLGDLIAVRPVVNDFFVVCDECLCGVVPSSVKDVLLFLKVIDLFDKLHVVFDSGAVLNDAVDYSSRSYSLCKASVLALFEKRLLLLQELLGSDDLKIKLPFMVDGSVLFEEHLREAFLIFKKDSSVTYALLNYVSNLCIKDRFDVVNFKIVVSGSFSDECLVPSDYSLSSRVVEMFFRVGLKFGYDVVDDGFLVSAPKGVKVALECLVREFISVNALTAGSLMIEEIIEEKQCAGTSTVTAVGNVSGSGGRVSFFSLTTSDGSGTTVEHAGFLNVMKHLFK